MDRTPATNSTYPKGGVSCSKESFVVKIPPIGNLQNVIYHTFEILKNSK